MDTRLDKSQLQLTVMQSRSLIRPSPGLSISKILSLVLVVKAYIARSSNVRTSPRYDAADEPDSEPVLGCTGFHTSAQALQSRIEHPMTYFSPRLYRASNELHTLDALYHHSSLVCLHYLPIGSVLLMRGTIFDSCFLPEQCLRFEAMSC